MKTPRKIDYELVRTLASMGCIDAEIACVLDFTPEWVCKRKKMDGKLAEAIEVGREKGKATLRRLQWQAASKGNPTMLIWLGKQMLGQRDHWSGEITGKDGGPVTMQNATEDIRSLADRARDFLARMGYQISEPIEAKLLPPAEPWPKEDARDKSQG